MAEMLRKMESLLFGSKFMLLVLSALYIAACAPGVREIKPSSKPLPDVGETIRHLDEIREKVFSLKGMASVKATFNDKDVNVKEVMVVKRPSKIRTEAVGVFGNPIFIFVLDGPAVSINRPAENFFYSGDIHSGGINLPFPVNEFGSEELADILLGSVSPINYSSSDVELSDDKKSYLLVLVSSDGLKKQVITVDAGDLLLKKSEMIDNKRGIAMSAEFGNYQEIGSLSFPKDITITFLNRPDSMQIKYEDIELNTDLPDGLFTLTPSYNNDR